MREVSVEGGRTYFDTNMSPHFHVYCEEDSWLRDVDEQIVDLEKLEKLGDIPDDMEIIGVDVTVKLRRKKA